MRTLADFLCILAGLVVGAVGMWVYLYTPPPQPAAEHRIRYPDEEALARRACGKYKLLYWWLEDLRAKGAIMHVQCVGQVRAKTEVKF